VQIVFALQSPALVGRHAEKPRPLLSGGGAARKIEAEAELGQDRNLESHEQGRRQVRLAGGRRDVGVREPQALQAKPVVGDEVVKDDRPEFRGMVKTVAHLVAVEEVD
jgi:large subunit ribosomal protein L30